MDRNIVETLRTVQRLREDQPAPAAAQTGAAPGGQEAAPGQAAQAQAQQPVDINQLTTAFQDLLKPITQKLEQIEKSVGGGGDNQKAGQGDNSKSNNVDSGNSGGNDNGGGDSGNSNEGNPAPQQAEQGQNGNQQKESLFKAIYQQKKLN
jgi:hypothetical protein